MSERFKEIYKLHIMLKSADIQHDFCEYGEYDPEKTYPVIEAQIFYPSKEDWYIVDLEKAREGCCSVIEGYGSMGHEKDLLEIMGLVDPEKDKDRDCYMVTVLGGLTAEEVFDRIQKADEIRKLNFKHFAKNEEV